MGFTFRVSRFKFRIIDIGRVRPNKQKHAFVLLLVVDSLKNEHPSETDTSRYLFFFFNRFPCFHKYADDSTIYCPCVEGYGLFERVSDAVIRMAKKQLYDLES